MLGRMPAAGQTQHWFYASRPWPPSSHSWAGTEESDTKTAGADTPNAAAETANRREVGSPPPGGGERGGTGEGYDACATGGASGSQWDPVTVSQSTLGDDEVCNG